jgi:hypothetical protein
MNQLKPHKTFTLLAVLSLLPLVFALGLALYQAFDVAAYTGISFSFARINSYIYAHSYGALLLVFFAGIQIGQALQNANRWLLIFNFMLLGLAWLSFHSFADAQGVILLLSCWLAALLIDFKAKQNAIIPAWYGRLKIKINVVVIVLLLILIMING